MPLINDRINTLMKIIHIVEGTGLKFKITQWIGEIIWEKKNANQWR